MGRTLRSTQTEKGIAWKCRARFSREWDYVSMGTVTARLWTSPNLKRSEKNGAAIRFSKQSPMPPGGTLRP